MEEKARQSRGMGVLTEAGLVSDAGRRRALRPRCLATIFLLRVARCSAEASALPSTSLERPQEEDPLAETGVCRSLLVPSMEGRRWAK